MIWHALVLVGSSVAPLFLAQRYHAACVKLKLHAIRSSHAILRAAWTLGNVGNGAEGCSSQMQRAECRKTMVADSAAAAPIANGSVES
jgi:hypothetical protein